MGIKELIYTKDRVQCPAHSRCFVRGVCVCVCVCVCMFVHAHTHTLSCSVTSDSLRLHRCYPPGSSVHGILPAGILDWVAISYSRGSS